MVGVASCIHSMVVTCEIIVYTLSSFSELFALYSCSFLSATLPGSSTGSGWSAKVSFSYQDKSNGGVGGCVVIWCWWGGEWLNLR